MPIIYKIISNIPKNNKFTHVILDKIDPIFFDILDKNVKIKVGKILKDQNNNSFKITGYFGEYLILKSERLDIHPIGTYLTEN